MGKKALKEKLAKKVKEHEITFMSNARPMQGQTGSERFGGPSSQSSSSSSKALLPSWPMVDNSLEGISRRMHRGKLETTITGEGYQGYQHPDILHTSDPVIAHTTRTPNFREVEFEEDPYGDDRIYSRGGYLQAGVQVKNWYQQPGYTPVPKTQFRQFTSPANFFAANKRSNAPRRAEQENVFHRRFRTKYPPPATVKISKKRKSPFFASSSSPPVVVEGKKRKKAGGVGVGRMGKRRKKNE